MKSAGFDSILEIILEKGNYKKVKRLVIDYAAEHAVDRSVIMTVAGASNCKMDYNALSRKEDFDMCTLFEEIARERSKRNCGDRAGIRYVRRSYIGTVTGNTAYIF